MGSTPYEIIDNKLVITKKGMANSLFVSTIIAFSLAHTLGFSFTEHWDTKAKYLKFIRITSNYVCFVSDIFITVHSKDRLASALKNMQSYDLATKFNEKNQGFWLVYCRIALIFSLSYWILVGYFAAYDHNTIPIIGFLSYTLFYSSISMQILNFSGLMLLLYQRFRHLSRLVQPKSKLLFF